MRPADDEEELQNEEEGAEESFDDSEPSEHSDYKVADLNDDSVKYQLSGMYETWYLDYASYVILDRAVPYLEDGLKPVQRRILHTMFTMEDGRYNKVANIVGRTMSLHPHGDSSIYGALVNIGQKELLVDTQGNWGNVLTGDGAAAGRYIEARLTKFAKDVAFNPKITEWKKSYDGRTDEPISLPIKFPLLLVQGSYGISVALSSRILPHNFNEVIDAAIAYLKGEDFTIYPDFPTGGMVDVTNYRWGARGGKVIIRSHIQKKDNKTLVVTDIPFGETSKTVIKSIIEANDKGKINIKHVDDNTSGQAEIVIQLSDKTSSDKTIDALYAFTKCQVSISPICCVIKEKKPLFCDVKSVLRMSTDHTKELLRLELENKRAETIEKLFTCSLEKIFIEERIYKDKEYENAKDEDTALKHIDKRLEPFKPTFVREVTREDLLKLESIKMARIHRYNVFESEERIARLQSEIDELTNHLEHLTEYAISWFSMLKNKYGEERQRITEIRNFDNIVATKVAEANAKLYVDREEGFIGTSHKITENAEFVCNCSDMDDIIIFHKDGKYMVKKVAEKLFVGKNILYVNVYKKKDTRTVYNVVYHDGRGGAYYMKRFNVASVTRDKEYDVTQGKPGSFINYFTANPNAEAEVIRVILRPRARLKVTSIEKNFGDLGVKGRQSMGNLLTKNEVHSIQLKSKGGSTMGGRKVWFDFDVLRVNYDGRGEFLGEFQSEDLLLVTTKKGECYTTNFDENNHFPDDLSRIEMFKEKKIWTAVLFDANEGYTYIKRFQIPSGNKPVSMIGDNNKSVLMLLTDTYYPRIEVKFGKADADKEPIEVDAESFIAVKGITAKGKRISQNVVDSVAELEPLRQPEIEEEETTDEIAADDDSQSVSTGGVIELSLFGDEQNDNDTK